MRVGLSRVRGTIAAIQDADLELDPAQIGSLVDPILAGDADVVYGSRFLHGAGAASGAVAGAVAGLAVGGPVGGIVGIAVGAVAGGLAGKGAAELVNPTAEELFWKETYVREPFYVFIGIK